MANYILRVTLPNGTVNDIAITQGMAIPAEQGARYSVINAETQVAADDIVLKKQEGNLIVEQNGEPLVEVDNFYAEEMQASLDTGTLTAAGDPVVVTATTEVAAETGVVWEAAGAAAAAGGIGGLGWAAAALGVAGVAVAAGGGGGGGGGGGAVAASGPDESIVIFDLVQGVSSSHSNRTFDPNVTYTIYIKVDGGSVGLNTGGTTANGANWGVWSATANLGSDDTLILVGDGSPVLTDTLTGVPAGPTQRNDAAATRRWSWGAQVAKITTLAGKFTFTRLTRATTIGGGTTSPVVTALLASNTSLPFPGPGGFPGIDVRISALPGNILTTQGLV